MSHSRDEVQAAVDRYCELRDAIERGDETWTALADLFTSDAVYIDPAWGRIQGIEEISAFLDHSMRGLEDWRFPITLTAVAGDHIIVRWDQILPSGHKQSGVSTIRYAGGGRFDYEEDILNMAHVLEDLKASGWRPGPGFQSPPASPNRDYAEP
jgi:limonene-1,2-epoxide hydrolase